MKTEMEIYTRKRLTAEEFCNKFIVERPWLKIKLDGRIEELCNIITETYETDCDYGELDIEDIVIEYLTGYLKNID